MPGPTRAGFLSFVRVTMGITTAQLPDNSMWIDVSYAVAVAIVNQDLASVPVPQQDSAGVALNPGVDSMYTLAVYDLSADNLINFAQDVQGAPPVEGSGSPGLPFFAWQRKQLNINGFVPGVIQSSSDQGTGNSLLVPDAFKDFTVANLQNLKTTYGRAYLGIAQSFGPRLYGMS